MAHPDVGLSPTLYSLYFCIVGLVRHPVLIHLRRMLVYFVTAQRLMANKEKDLHALDGRRVMASPLHRMSALHSYNACTRQVPSHLSPIQPAVIGCLAYDMAGCGR